MSKRKVTFTPTNTIQVMKQQGKAQPFGAHFATKLQGINSKLVCALSSECPDIGDGGETSDPDYLK